MTCVLITPSKVIVLPNGGKAVIDEADWDRELCIRFPDGTPWVGRVRYQVWRRKSDKGTDYVRAHGWDGSGSRVIYLHRLLVESPANMACHHIDGDGLNNRRSNLALLQLAEHSRRHAMKRRYACYPGRKTHRATSRFKGVCWFHRQGRSAGRWRAKVRANGRSVTAGEYGTEMEAALAYDRKARELLGEDAIVNFPNTK